MKNNEIIMFDLDDDFLDEAPNASSGNNSSDEKKQKPQTSQKKPNGATRGTSKNSELPKRQNTASAGKQNSNRSTGSKNSHNDQKSSSQKEKKKLPGFLNFHFFFLLFIVCAVIFIVCRFKNWGVRVNLKELLESIRQDDSDFVYEETFDSIMPLIGADGYGIDQDVKNILLFGNAPFADDRDSNDGLAKMIEKATNANVINLSVADSYSATSSFGYEPENYPLDLFAPYWLAEFLTSGITKEYYDLAEPYLSPERMAQARELYQTMESIDMNSIDVAVFMYDATDFFMDKKPSDVNLTDTTTFAGNITAAIELLSSYYPGIRFIVLSPTYAYSIDENGNYTSSELTRNSYGPLSDYAIFECNGATTYLCVSFVDNYFGTITEENADKYLQDNLHLNQDGRKKVLDRFLYALNYYKKNK